MFREWFELDIFLHTGLGNRDEKKIYKLESLSADERNQGFFLFTDKMVVKYHKNIGMVLWNYHYIKRIITDRVARLDLISKLKLFIKENNVIELKEISSQLIIY